MIPIKSFCLFASCTKAYTVKQIINLTGKLFQVVRFAFLLREKYFLAFILWFLLWESKCKFCTVIYDFSMLCICLPHFLCICFVILFLEKNFHMPFWLPSNCRTLHVWCCGTECDYSIAFKTTTWISFYETFSTRLWMRVCNFIVDINVNVYSNWACSSMTNTPHTALYTRIWHSLAIIHLWMDWQKIRIRLHLIEMERILTRGNEAASSLIYQVDSLLQVRKSI